VIVLDTTVLVYAAGVEHPLRAPCRRLLEAHTAENLALVTTIEVIQEFAHVRARRRSRTDAVARARSLMDTLSLLSSTTDDLDLGLTLFEDHPEIGAFDALLAAVALNRHAEALVSADGGFGEVPGLNWIDPATPALDRLLAR
jgi:uncharacterized protein